MRASTRFLLSASSATVLLFSRVLAAQESSASTTPDLSALSSITSSDLSSRPLLLLLVFGALSVAPFVGMLVTSFVKIAIVLSITRQAVGLQQAPPTPVITGLAILLTVYVMQPVGIEIYNAAEKHFQYRNQDFMDKSNIDVLAKAVRAAEKPMKEFLRRHSSPRNIQMFYHLGQKMRTPKDRIDLTPNDYLVLVPSFIISELTSAFQIGFIIFLPFLIVDMVVSNILMALGMQMLSPTTISLPFKILLFVMVDGWYLITKGLVLSYNT